MKRYHLTFIVSSQEMTRHDINAWLRDTLKVTKCQFKLDDMMAEGGQMFSNANQSITAIATEYEDESSNVVESANAIKH